MRLGLFHRFIELKFTTDGRRWGTMKSFTALYRFPGFIGWFSLTLDNGGVGAQHLAEGVVVHRPSIFA